MNQPSTISNSVTGSTPCAADLPRTPFTWVEGWVLGLLMLCNLAPIWITDRFPSQNGPWFLLPTHMFREYHNPAFDYAAHFVRNWRPIPHMLHDLLVGILAAWIPLFTAERLVLSLQAVLLPWSAWRFLEAVAPGRRWLAYPACLLVLSFPFFRGYHDYTLSVILYFLTLAYWYPRRHALTAGSVVVLWVLCLLTYLSHLVVFGLLAGSLGWLVLFETRRWGRALRSTLLLTGPIWALTIEYLLANRQATWIDRSDTEFRRVTTNLAAVLFEGFYSVSTPAAWLMALAFASVIPWTVWQRRQVAAEQRPPLWQTLQLPLGTLLIFFCLLYFVAPYKIIGWHKANTRLIPLIGILLLAVLARLLPRAPSPRALAMLWTPLVVAAPIASGIICREVVAMHAAVDDFVSGIPLVGRNPRLLQVLVDNPAFGGIRPITRCHDYYHLERGGVSRSSLPALSTLSLMQYREYPVDKNFPKYDSDSSDAEALQTLRVYTHVLVWGRDEVLEKRLAAADFRQIHQRGLFQLFRRSDVTED
jgi:hypothetical protein